MDPIHLVVLDPNLCWGTSALHVKGALVFHCMDAAALAALVRGERTISVPRHLDNGSQVPFFLPEIHLRAALVHQSDIRAAREMIAFVQSLRPVTKVIPLKQRRFTIVSQHH